MQQIRLLPHPGIESEPLYHRTTQLRRYVIFRLYGMKLPEVMPRHNNILYYVGMHSFHDSPRASVSSVGGCSRKEDHANYSLKRWLALTRLPTQRTTEITELLPHNDYPIRYTKLGAREDHASAFRSA